MDKIQEIRERLEASVTHPGWYMNDTRILLDKIDADATILIEREKFVMQLGDELTGAAEEINKQDAIIAEGREIVTNLMRLVIPLKEPERYAIGNAWLKKVK